MAETLFRGGESEASVHSRAVRSLFAIFEEICDGAVSVDRQGRIVWINQKYRVLLGIPDGCKVLGRPIEDIIPESRLRHVVATGRPILLDIMRFGDRHFVVSRLPLKDDGDRVIGAIGFVLFDRPDYLRPVLERFEGLQRKLKETERRLSEERRTRYSLSSFIGGTRTVIEVKRQALKAARMAEPILLRGETGTGKELLAHAIHASSQRSAAPFVAVNVAALPETLIESELFGYAPGSFTGSDRKGRDGKFIVADGGTLFLDEIGDLPLPLQAKLLRVLEGQEVEALGTNRIRRVDVRLVAATSRDLWSMVRQHAFRDDLYFRLSVLTLTTCPLRDRLDDLPALCDHLLGELAVSAGPEPRIVDDGALAVFRRYAWPGNVRELRNVLARMCLIGENRELGAREALAVLDPTELTKAGHKHTAPLDTAVAEFERTIIRQALHDAAGRKAEAARRLGISRSRLYDKMAGLGVS